jgi:Na+-translocating ferredoxin:NAD+ oxidoreductase RnfC subunit
MLTRNEREQELTALIQSANGQTIIRLDFVDASRDRGLAPTHAPYSAMIEAILAYEFPEHSSEDCCASHRAGAQQSAP